MLRKQKAKQVYAKCLCLLKKLKFLHNVCLLALHLLTLCLICHGFYRHMYTGLKFHPSRLSSLDLWPKVARAARSTVRQAALGLLTMADGWSATAAERKRNNKTALMFLHDRLKVVLLCFVTFELLRRRPRPRWTLVYLTAFTVLGILEVANRFNLFAAQKNEFVEWLNDRGKWRLTAAFLFLYPLLTLSEVVLMLSSHQHLKCVSAYRAFPSPMPNRYNFSINLHSLYKLVPVPLALSSALVYIRRWRAM